MTAAASVSEDELRTMLAERSGLDRDALWGAVYFVPRTFGLAWPLPRDKAEEVLAGLLDNLRHVLPPPRHEEQDGHQRYVFLSEITEHYERYDTRRLLERIRHAGATPTGPSFGADTYDPRSEQGWGARPSAAADHSGKPSWGWWRAVREAGPRPLYRMPNPYVGEGPPPVDRCLALRDRTGDTTAYREALLAAVREDPRQIDCWAHLGSNALARGEAEMSALREALGFYQTAVAVAELSLPPHFTGVLAWSEMDNRPMHRALQGLGLTWSQLGEQTKARAVFRNGLWTNPADQLGLRYLIGQATAGPRPRKPKG
ncbi:hypothetical protein AB0393_28140 [Streptomyces cyaneofuscatus]|uniref:hypothetical protein n=1 Tax=Streptomyces cyaneofuscatus TaxID=66883 RepID=UPI00344C8084